MPVASVASFNLHSGVDGWGRPYDVAGVCADLDADVIVLQENWTPRDGVGIATRVGEALGYEVHAKPIRHGRLISAHPDPGPGWKPPYEHLDGPRIALPDIEDRRRPTSQDRRSTVGDRPRSSRRRWPAGAPSERGAWSVAVLSRLPVREARWVDLGQLRRDLARRGAWRLSVDVEGSELVLVATHAAHLMQGSPLHFRKMRSLVPPPSVPGALVGDMNAWTPVLRAFFPRLRPSVRGATWPAWRAHSQIDHILVTPATEVLSGRVLPMVGSDHLPIRAELRIA